MPFPSVGQSTLTTAILNPYSGISTNPIINGGFEIWQRGTSLGITNTSGYCADRWIGNSSGLGASTTMASFQTSDFPPVAALVPTTSFCHMLQSGVANLSIISSTIVEVQQRIEGYLWQPFAQKQFTVGFWVKSPVTGIYCVSVLSSDVTRMAIQEYTINVANTWEYKTVTFAASPASTGGAGWNYTTGIGIFLNFFSACGSASSTGTTLGGTWFTGTAASQCSPNQVNVYATSGNTFRLWGVTMGLGPTVAPYFPRPYITELAMCQRYCSVSNPYSLAVAPVAVGLCTGTNSTRVEHPLPQPMRGVPTSAVASGNFDIYFNASVSPIVTIPVNVLGDRMVEFLTTHTGGLLTTGAGAILFTHDTTSKITVSAEL